MHAPKVIHVTRAYWNVLERRLLDLMPSQIRSKEDKLPKLELMSREELAAWINSAPNPRQVESRKILAAPVFHGLVGLRQTDERNHKEVKS